MVYRPVLDRLTFAGTLAGLGLVSHLYVQAKRGFAGGCTGFDPNSIAEPTSGCAAALSSSYSMFLGVSNTTWGFLFYGILFVLSLLLVLQPERLPLLKRLRGAVLSVGVLYALYLMFVLLTGRADGFCVLCFSSHVLTLMLFTFFVVDATRPHRNPTP